ncbi:MAG: hypothetical protein GWN94_26490 [Phycisphaerae bacterium]|nr:hypothetical protein [Phycisphaerae bacterium]
MKNPQSDSPPKPGVNIYIPPKLASALLALLIGSGAGVLGGFKWLNGSDSDESSHTSDLENREQNYNVRFESIESTQKVHTTKIGKLEKKTNDIQTVQHGDIARTEARRVTADIRDRHEREREYDRLVDLNLKRLKEKKPPCNDRRCRD